jgi:hypothetical protein
LLEVGIKERLGDARATRIGVVAVEERPALADKTMSSQVGGEPDHLFVLLDIHRAQDGGLDLTDIAESARDVVIAKNGGGACGGMDVVGLLKLRHVFPILFHTQTIAGCDLIRPGCAGGDLINIDCCTGAGALGNDGYDARLGRAGFIKVVTGQLFFISDVFCSVLAPIVGKWKVLWNDANFVRPASRNLEYYRLCAALGIALQAALIRIRHNVRSILARSMTESGKIVCCKRS